MSELKESGIIFVDFETNKRGDFYLVGTLFRENFRQVILNPSLIGLARHKKLDIESPKDFGLKLLDIMQEGELALAAYSEAEKNVIRSLLGHEKGIEDYSHLKYINLLKAAKSWRYKYKRSEFENLGPFRTKVNAYQAKNLKNSLGSIMRLTNFNAPSDYAPGRTTARFDAVINSLNKRGQIYEDMTPVQKAKATKALKHNEYDVRALQVLYGEIMKDDAKCFGKAITPLFDVTERDSLPE